MSLSLGEISYSNIGKWKETQGGGVIRVIRLGKSRSKTSHVTANGSPSRGCIYATLCDDNYRVEVALQYLSDLGCR